MASKIEAGRSGLGTKRERRYESLAAASLNAGYVSLE